MRVTVIMPSHDYGRFIAEAVRSVQAQSLRDWELIAVDDGSTDDTQAILAAFDEPRLRVLRLPRCRGVSAARNLALEHARGELAAFLDADDLWHPRKLELQLELLDAHPELGFVFSDAVRFDERGDYLRTVFDFARGLRELRGRPALDGSARVLDEPFALARLPVSATWTSTVVVQRRGMEDLRFPEGVRIGEDFHYFARALERVGAGYVDAPLTRLRRHGNNSFLHAAEAERPMLDVLADLERRVAAKNRPVIRARLGQALAEHARQLFEAGERRACARACARALRYPGGRRAAAKRLAALALPGVARAVGSVRAR